MKHLSDPPTARRPWRAIVLVAAAAMTGSFAACSSSNSTGGDTTDDGGSDAALDGHREARAPVDANAFYDVNFPDFDGSTPPDAGIDSPPPFDAGIDSPPPPVDAGLDAPIGADCGTTPTLHPEDGGPGTLFCPFGPDAGLPLWCDPGTQLCCIYGIDDAGIFPPSECAGACTNGPAPATIACEDQSDCTPGSVCCTNAVPTQDVACGYYFGHGLTESTCRPTACNAGEVQICSSAAQCTSPQTCIPFKEKGMQLGFCQ